MAYACLGLSSKCLNRVLNYMLMAMKRNPCIFTVAFKVDDSG